MAVYGDIQHSMKARLSILNKYKRNIGAGLVLILLLSGCYNNTHIRTQRVLEPGGKVISANAGMAVLLADNPGGSYRIEENGISAFRAGVSYLGLHRGLEQGINIGLGLTGEGNTDLTIGYDIRKVKAFTGNKPYRYGLHVELNSLLDSGLEGNVYQLRPYLMTITSESKNMYAGVHGLLSFGDLTGNDYNETWDPNLNQWTYGYVDYKYRVSSIGLGITVGNEMRLGNVLLQSQIDLSLVNQTHELAGTGFDDNEWGDWNPLDKTGPVIGISTAIRRAPKRVVPDLSYLNNARAPIGTTHRKEAKKVNYDPFTGQMVVKESTDEALRFDPITGELIKATKPAEFDPLTGEAITVESSPQFDPATGLQMATTPEKDQAPVSLLSAEEKSALMTNELKITYLNGNAVNARVIDIQDQGMVVFQVAYGKSGMQTITYDKIRGIKFAGKRKGISGGFEGALAGCGLGVVLPLALSIGVGEPEMIFLGMLTAPVGSLGGFIYGALKNDSYTLNFNAIQTVAADNASRSNIILHTTKVYLKTGSFPKTDLPKTPAGVKP